jgi:chromosome segregation ATPase
MQMAPSTSLVPQQVVSMGGASLSEVLAIFKEQREEAKADRAEMDAKLEAKDAKMQAQLDEQRAEIDKLREQAFESKLREQTMEAKLREQALEAKMPQPASETISEDRLEALQTRVHALHTAELLTAEELDTIEDIIADLIEAMPTMLASHSTAERVLKMVLLSEKMAVDGSFARQLRTRTC